MRVALVCAVTMVMASCDETEAEPSIEAEGEVEAEAEDADDAVSPEFSTCEQLDAECRDEAICDVWTCGGPPALYNHGGCPRTPCASNDDCGSGESCYPRVYGGPCLSSEVRCAGVDGACECEPSDDCDGTLDAHCLPVSVYDPANYCDPSSIACADLPAWMSALQQAAAEHDVAAPEMAASLRACAAQAADAAQGC
ncbi:MAG: hypothetical protein AAGA54_13035 [Myxococcota bacterium]